MITWNEQGIQAMSDAERAGCAPREGELHVDENGRIWHIEGINRKIVGQAERPSDCKGMKQITLADLHPAVTPLAPTGYTVDGLAARVAQLESRLDTIDRYLASPTVPPAEHAETPDGAAELASKHDA